MAVSRPLMLAFLGAVLVGALFFATMGARQGPAEPDQPKISAPQKAPAAEGAAGRRSKAKSKPAAGASETAARPKPKPQRAVSKGLPAGVARAIERKHTVVLFFRQRGSADDDATAQAVASLRSHRKVQVFSAPISRLADYAAVAGRAGVSRAPAVVVVGPKGDAHLIEGFVDRETLAQEVADAR